MEIHYHDALENPLAIAANVVHKKSFALGKLEEILWKPSEDHWVSFN